MENNGDYNLYLCNLLKKVKKKEFLLKKWKKEHHLCLKRESNNLIKLWRLKVWQCYK